MPTQAKAGSSSVFSYFPPKKNPLKGGGSEPGFYPAALDAGVSHIRLFDGTPQPLARNFFIHPAFDTPPHAAIRTPKPHEMVRRIQRDVEFGQFVVALGTFDHSASLPWSF